MRHTGHVGRRRGQRRSASQACGEGLGAGGGGKRECAHALGESVREKPVTSLSPAQRRQAGVLSHPKPRHTRAWRAAARVTYPQDGCFTRRRALVLYAGEQRREVHLSGTLRAVQGMP